MESEIGVSFVENNQPTPPMPPNPGPPRPPNPGPPRPGGPGVNGPGSGGSGTVESGKNGPDLGTPGGGDCHGDVNVLPDSPGTGMLGPLSIDYVSTFHSREIPDVEDVMASPAVIESGGLYARYRAPADRGTNGTPISNFIQLTDNRTRSQRNGWILTVEKVSYLKRIDASGSVLTHEEVEATTIELSDLRVTTDNEFEAPWINGSVLLTPQLSSVVARAEDKGVGSGTWVITFGDVRDVGAHLIVPTASILQPDGGYTATLRWVLSDAPL